MTELQKSATDVDQVPRPSFIDGMGMVRKVRNNGAMFNEFADELLKYALTSSSDAKRIDIVFDVYPETLIKNAERGHREVGRLSFKKIIGSQYMKQWESFPSSDGNILFSVSRRKYHYFANEMEVNVAGDTFCVNLQPNDERPDLSCNHEEADTRMLLHAKQITDTNMRNIVLSTPYTDVFLIGIVALNQINVSHFIRTGTKNNVRIISISKVKEALQMKYVPKGALLGLRQFWAIESRLKMIKNAFYFTSKALFVHKIFQF